MVRRLVSFHDFALRIVLPMSEDGVIVNVRLVSYLLFSFRKF